MVFSNRIYNGKNSRYIFLNYQKNVLHLQPQTKKGTLAQLVEQWTENPCVPGSIPGGTTFLSLLLSIIMRLQNKNY